MRPVTVETYCPAIAGDDGDPHLVETPGAYVVRQRYRPSMADRFAILAGAEIELTLSDTGPALAVVHPE